MISYKPFWNTLKEKKISQYQLIHYWNISSNTLRRMKKNEPISTTTLNELCLILECPVEQILKFEADKEEVKQISEKRKNIPAKKIKN
ncbi:MAG: helix-turn-helix transcriptional regulator [Lachnospiraceae bacterium]|nr:helix-turn-helix transcriptional regulator [Lachnospiraceae bacterium]